MDRGELPGTRYSGAQRRNAAQPRLEHGAARARVGADRRPDQPLQHDVRSLLHGREPGRLRPRAELGRDSGNPRQRDEDQAAPADVGAVLGRRADDVAVLLRRGPLRAQGGLQQRAGGDQRHRVRQEQGIREEGLRSGAALRLPAIRRHRQRRQQPPSGRQPVRREAARHREPARSGHRDRAGDDDRQQREQRSGGPDREVRDGEPQENFVRVLPAGFVHRARRGHYARAPHPPALHAFASGAETSASRSAKSNRRATGSRFPTSRRSLDSPTSRTDRIRSGVRFPADATRTAA